MATAVSGGGGGRWTRVRTLGRGASGAVVWLAADDATGALFAVKSAPAGAASRQLRREWSILSALRSPHVVPCLGLRADGGGAAGCQLLLEYAPGGSLAEVSGLGGDERAVAAYAADVARGLAYLHARSLVHGDVKARNVVVGADGRAMLADFGCARAVGSASASGSGSPIIGGTPAFMAPEVARGEEQGPAADVWALGCTVLEMATGRAPWSDVDSVPAAVRRIGYTDAVPEVPRWMSADAKDFLARCFARDPRRRCTAAQLLDHPFLASAAGRVKAAAEWVSPKSTLDAALWESDADESDDEGDAASESPAQRIKALACPCSALPDWDSEEDGDWIQVIDEQCEAKNLVPTKKDAAEDETASEDECQLLLSEVLETEVDFIDADAEGDDDPGCLVAVGFRLTTTAPSVEQQLEDHCTCTPRGACSSPTAFLTEACHNNNFEMSKSFLLKNCPLFAVSSVLLVVVVLLLFVLRNDYPFSHCSYEKDNIIQNCLVSLTGAMRQFQKHCSSSRPRRRRRGRELGMTGVPMRPC